MSATPKADRREKPGKPRKKGKAKRFAKALFVTAAVGAFAGMVGYLLIVLNGYRLLAENLDKIDMAEASIVYDANNNEIVKLYRAEGNREIVSLHEMPELLVKTVVAAEDRRFYEHQGVDYFAIGRALYKDIMARSAVEGGSTITQQLAKNLFLDADKTLFRKATEASIALALERRYPKDKILEMYLNRIYFGGSAYGVEAAVKQYFGKSVKDKNNPLSVAEIAMLAGLPKNPNGYSPFRNPERAKERRAVVLSIMAEQGLITEEEKNKAMEDNFASLNKNQLADVAHPAYIDYVTEEIEKLANIPAEELFIGGYRIYTAMDPKAQQAMEQAYANDKLFPKKLSGQTQDPESGMVIVEQSSGEIVAMVGGREYARKGLNRAIEPRQPGSSFKPIAVYAPALESGQWTPYSRLSDTKQCFDDYCPQNYNGKYLGEVSMIHAVRDSINIPAVWLLNQLSKNPGMTKVIQFVESLGIDLDDAKDRNLAIALGGLTTGTSPLKMAQAYSAFANNGQMHQAHAVVKIEDSDGRVRYKYDRKPKQVMSAKTAYYMTLMLEDAVLNGTGRKARMDRPVAGKTGTTQETRKDGYNRDIWFVGYTPQYTAAVWIGFDKPDAKHYLGADSGQAAAVFREVMAKALAGREKGEFKRPSSVPQLKEPPKAPSGLTAAYDPEKREVTLTWQPAGERITYRVFRQDGDQQPKQLAETPHVELCDITIQPGATYKYYVVAFDPDQNAESGKSNVAEVVIPDDQGLPLTPSPSLEPQLDASGSPRPSGSPGGGRSPTPRPETSGGGATNPSPSERLRLPGDGGEMTPGGEPDRDAIVPPDTANPDRDGEDGHGGRRERD